MRLWFRDGCRPAVHRQMMGPRQCCSLALFFRFAVVRKWRAHSPRLQFYHHDARAAEAPDSTSARKRSKSLSDQTLFFCTMAFLPGTTTCRRPWRAAPAPAATGYTYFFPLARSLSSFGGRSPGEVSHASICDAVPACRARLKSNSRAVPGGSLSAASLKRRASSASRSWKVFSCLMRRRFCMRCPF